MNDVSPTQKTAIQYLVEEVAHFDPVVMIGDEPYVRDRSGEVKLPPADPLGTPIGLATLSGLAEFVAANVDGLDLSKHLVVVDSPLLVQLIGPRTGRRHRRQILVECKPDIPRFEFGKWLGFESFNIALQSQFHYRDDDRKALLQAIARIKSGTDVVQEDNGTSQRVQVTKGIDLVVHLELPNPVTLAPWRTFVEVLPVESKFILRCREEGRGVELALFEADGGFWRIQTVERIKATLDIMLSAVDSAARPKLVV